MSLKKLKILLLLSFCLIIYRNELYSLFLGLNILLEVSNFYFYSITAIAGMAFLLLNIVSTRLFNNSIYFFISCILFLLYLAPYFANYERIIEYIPSLITFSLFYFLLITTIVVEVKVNFIKRLKGTYKQ